MKMHQPINLSEFKNLQGLQEHGLKSGIYFDLPDEIYHADTAVSRSDIRLLNKSPHKFWLTSRFNPEYTPPRKTKDSLLRGKMWHKLLFEPDTFHDIYVIQPDYGRYSDKVMIKRSEYDSAVKAIEILKKTYDDVGYFRNGQAEVTIVFMEEKTGIKCRTRYDYLRSIGAVDYKTTEKDADRYGFGWDLYKYGYDIQDALYRMALKSVCKQIKAGTAQIYNALKEEQKLFCALLLSDEQQAIINNDYVFGFNFVVQESFYPYAAMDLDFDEEIRANAVAKIISELDNYCSYFEHSAKVEGGITRNPFRRDRKFITLTKQHVPSRIFHEHG